MEEIWKDVCGYEGDYKVSNLGNVLSYPKQGNGYRTMILKAYIVGKDRNYLAVRLYKNKRTQQFKVHRLVVTMFLDNPEDKPQVNHIDGDTFNNKLNNLEWCDNSENQLHAYNMGLHTVHDITLQILKKAQEISKIACAVPIVQFDLNYNFIKYYGGITSAVNTNLYGASIRKCCFLASSSSYGFKWRQIKDCKLTNKVIILCGKSAVGKTYILDKVQSENKVNSLVSHTTRPKRLKEVEGIDYYYITEEDFKNKMEQGEFIECRRYDTEFGIWYYGLSINELEKDNGICIVDLKGLKELKKKIGEHNIISIYIDCDYDIRKDRAINRDDITEEKIKEIERRFEKDELDFPSEDVAQEYDYILNNSNTEELEDTINKIHNIIKNNTKHSHIDKKIFPNEIRKNELCLNEKWYNSLIDISKEYKINYQKLKTRFNICNNIQVCIDNNKWNKKIINANMKGD